MATGGANGNPRAKRGIKEDVEAALLADSVRNAFDGALAKFFGIV